MTWRKWKMTTLSNSKIRDLFAQADTILLSAHIRPDGDAIGSLLGLGLALRNAGKKVLMVLSDGIPAQYHYLYGSNEVKKSVPDNLQFDLSIILDTSDLERTGGIFGNREITINIDHHTTNTLYAKYNFIDPQAVATCSLIAENIENWGLKIDDKVASLLLTGILTDTIGFRTSNMGAKDLRIAAYLMEFGANLPELYKQALVNKSTDQLIYWGFALKKLEKKDRLCWTSLTLDDRKDAGYNGNDDADLNTILSSNTDCDVSILFVEQKNNHVKVSWRSNPGFNVANLAQFFGGGGHPAASGADIEGTMVEVQAKVFDKTLNFLKEKN